MAYARKLPSGQWQGGYRDADGKQRSAGTYATEAAALLAANRAASGETGPIHASAIADEFGTRYEHGPTFTADQVAALLSALGR